MQPLPIRRRLSSSAAGALLLGLLGLAASTAPGVPPQAPDTASEAASESSAAVQVFVLRHAETAASTREVRDPELSEAGSARAAALDALLAEAGVTHLFTSPYARTRATLAPLAARLELTPAEYDPSDAEGLSGSLAELPAGSTAVVSGHSNTAPGLVHALTAEWPERLERDAAGGGNLPHDSHERLYLVTLVDGRSAGLLELTLPDAE